MKTEECCICPSCGKKVSTALKFCPVCMLRGALASDVESGESSSEHAVEPTSQDAAQRFEHYELATGEDGRPFELGRGALGVTYNPSIWDPSRLSLFESGDTLVGLKSSAATAELGRPSATFSTDTSRTELLPMSFMVNGRYQVLEALGEGGMGVVYRVADQLHPERALALKTIQSAMLMPERINMFKAEFRTMADLCHPNVATVYDFEPLRDGVDYLFTMEHVDGADLMAATRGAGQERVVGLVVQICRALSYLHSRGIVHFDLKPANILVRSDDTVKVLDFGLVGSDRRGSVVGTPSYIAPELVSGGTSIDHRVDLYSLGIIIYELLCRRLPFTARTLYDLLHMHATVDVAFTADDAERIPQWLQQIVRRLCAKEPAERFRTANAVIEQINRSSGGAHQIETAATKESYILSSRFVGRQAQLDAVLSHVWARTNQNEQIQSCALFVVGPSGVGKTRLVREAKRQIQLAGLPFIDANVRDNGLADHTPIVELLNHISQVATSAGAGELVEQHERSLRQLGVGLSREGATALSDAERKAALEGAADFMIGVAERVAYVIHIGDLQWASTGVEDLTLALLVRLSVSSERRIKLALIGSYRDEELSGRALEAHLAALRSHAAIGVVALEALGNGHVRGLLSSMLGIEELPPAFVDRVCAETGGNPFFVEEVMRSLVEHGGVYIEDGGWATSDDIAQLDIPSSITQVLLRRIAVLTPEAERVLELLAIAARPVDTSVLEAAAGLSSDHFYSALSTLVARQMVEGLKGGLYCLRHDGLRQAILSRRETAQIAQMHGELAQAMERVYKLELDLHVHDLALHYWRAGERQKALSFGLIGRHAEMLALKKSWNDVRAGRGSTLLLEGESGMGKTRLARELTKLARCTGASTQSSWRASCSEPAVIHSFSASTCAGWRTST